MRGNILFILVFLLILFGLDFYIFQGIKAVMQQSSPVAKKIIYFIYWSITVFLISGALLFLFWNGENWSKTAKSFFMSLQLINLVPKLFFLVFMLMDDLQRGFRWLVQKFFVTTGTQEAVDAISRSEFLLKTGLAVAAIPLFSISYGVAAGAHDYRVKRIKIPLKNLPASFHGVKIAQISDIHTGSFYNKNAVKGGVEMLLAEKPDVAFFTGDLVNEVAGEVKEYIEIFGKVKAPLGVYSVLGNHDYGDYVPWPSQVAKRENLNMLINAHKHMGWDLLMDENRTLEQSGDKISIIGVENWGAGARWPKYGKLDQAIKGTDDAAVKLLLSHDPSHWDAQIKPLYKDIDVTFAGHTHGCQFGIELGGFRWSPAQYLYKQWAGLYTENNQHLYVNRGYGFIGFPGRVGMPPEITIFELVKV